MKPIWITMTRMFVAPDFSKLCATALLVFSSLILSITSAIAAPDEHAHATALKSAAYAGQEKRQELEGELEVIYEDYKEHSKSRLRHILKTKNGRVELHLPENAKSKALQSGTKVRVRGWQFKNSEKTLDSMALSDEPGGLMVLAQDGTSSTTIGSTTTAVLPNTLGEQRTLVLLLNFQDNPVRPWTVEETREMVFGTVNDFYKENSNGQTWLSGDVEGYLTLQINGTCDFGTMDGYAQQAAKDSGIDVGSYNRLLYLFPKNGDCGWRGQGTVGGRPSRSWINGELNLLTIGHEIGHNFGLYHAKYISCNDGNISESCVSLEYGDNLDIMGKSTGHFNAFNKERLGWLSTATGEIVTAATDGSYLLEPYEFAPAGSVKALKVRRGTDPTTGLPLWYHLEYRQAQGFDSFLAGKSITNGVLFHLNRGSDINSSQLMDMTPNSSFYDLDDAALVAGSSYSDPDAGVTITTEWADSSGASVHISFAEASCIKANPVISLTANESTREAGSTASYRVTVTNNDSNACSASDYSVSANVPAGWEATASTVNLPPGASDTVTLNITSAETASDGAYEIIISAENSSYQNSAVASYVLETPIAVCTLANPLLSLTANQSGEVAAGTTVNYTATVTSQDSSGCDAAVIDIVSSVSAGWSADGVSVTLEPGGTASVNLNVTSATNADDGIYNFSINAQNRSDANYSSSALGSYIVTTPPPVCLKANPLVSLSVPSGTVTAGTTVNYSATVTNLDSSECAAANFAVNADIPASWSASSSSINLAPGESATVNISVTSATTASDGTYGLTLYAKNTVDSSLFSSAMGSYVIETPQAPLNSAPVAINDSVTLPAKEALLIDVLANDSDMDGDSLSIIAVSQGTKGSVEISSDGLLLYTPVKSFKGNDSFSYTISDGDKTATATVIISLAGAGDGGGKKGKGKRNK